MRRSNVKGNVLVFRNPEEDRTSYIVWVIVSVCMMEDLMMVKEVESEREKDILLNKYNMTQHPSLWKTAIYLGCWNAYKRVSRGSLDSNIEGCDENQSRTLPKRPKLRCHL